MFDDLYSKAPYPLNCFLEEISNYILIHFDQDFNIIGFNKKLLRKLNLKETEIRNYKFYEIFKVKNKELNNLKPQKINKFERIECYISDEFIRRKSYIDYICYFFYLDDEDEFYLIGKQNKSTNNEIFNEISKLNNELENTTRELNKKNLKLEYQLRFQKNLAEISSDLLEVNQANIDRKINKALKKIGKFFGIDRSYIFIFSNNHKKMSNSHEWCREDIEPHINNLQDFSTKNFSWWMDQLLNNKTINITDVNKMPEKAEAEKMILKAQNIKSVVSMPMFIENELFGFFDFDSVKVKKEFSEEELRALNIFTDVITSAFSKYIHDKKIRKLTYKDRLTGLYNRRFFEEELERLDTKRQLPISIILADINGLKIINDSLGHKKGDQLLKKSSNILRKITRKEDILARQGGDEFAILLPKTEREKAEKIIDRINEEAQKTEEDELTVSIALGVAVKTDPLQDIEEVLKTADNNMYENKLLESRSAKGKIVQNLLNTLAVKSNETKQHTIRMTKLAYEFGNKLNLSNSEINRLTLLSTLHDIGKTTIEEKILKKPDDLTNEEWEIMKEHPRRGYKIASASEEFALIAQEILSHHERWDGTGYPRGLKGEDIPFLSRVISIIDAYDVMTNDRPYSKAISKEKALAEIESCVGSQFDPDLAEEFIELKSDR